MSAVRRRRALATSVLALVLVPHSVSCGSGGAPEFCSTQLDFTLVTPDEELDVVVVGCTNRGRLGNPKPLLSVDLDVRPDADPQQPIAVAFDRGGTGNDGLPWRLYAELEVEAHECGRLPIRLHRLDDDQQTSMSGSLDAQLEVLSEASCSVTIEE